MKMILTAMMMILISSQFFLMGIHDDGDDVDDDYFDTDEVIILSWHGSTVAIHPAGNQRAA